LKTGFRSVTACTGLTAVFAAVLLTACGGGGGNNAGLLGSTANPTGQSAGTGQTAATGTGQTAGTGTQTISLPDVPDGFARDSKAACSLAGIGALKLTTDDGSAVTITNVATGTTTATAASPAVDYCEVDLTVAPAVRIVVGMPLKGWNGRLRSEGNGVYAGGTPVVAQDSVRQGFAGVTTDTGHPTSSVDGSFGMITNTDGTTGPNTQLQADFAYRSEHLMAYMGKQVVKAFYDQDALRTYWYGCSTGGRQGMMMAQRYPQDYDAILAGASAMHWDRFQAAQLWGNVVFKALNVYPTSSAVINAKLNLATSQAVAACDGADGVVDGVLGDPRTCTYDPRQDATITKPTCTTADGTCLTPNEADAIQRLWGGARGTSGNQLWPGFERGASLTAMAGVTPFVAPIQQAKYWVYFDPTWDWTTVTLNTFETFFNDNVAKVGPMMASDNPDISAFKARGGKVIMYHGWADQLIMPEGSTKYYESMKATVANADQFSRLYMVPGMGHCSGGGTDSFGQGSSGAVPMTPDRDIFRALMAWSEKGTAPSSIIASKLTSGVVTRTRPLCPYPQVAKYNGTGSTDDAANFSCANP